MICPGCEFRFSVQTDHCPRCLKPIEKVDMASWQKFFSALASYAKPARQRDRLLAFHLSAIAAHGIAVDRLLAESL